MRMLIRQIWTVGLIAVGFGTITIAPGSAIANDAAMSADLVVFTASPGGITTAVAAARLGVDVVVIEPTAHVGGIVAQGGLVLSDLGDETTIGGLARDFFARIERHYATTYGPTSPQREHTKFQAYPGGCFEPKVAEMVYEGYLAEHSNIRVLRESRLVQVEKDGSTINAIVVEQDDATRMTIRGRIFVDASYTGDLLAMAGVSYHIGRESREETGESLARSKPDRGIQAYNYRLTMTDDPDNRVAIDKPEGYDPEVYRYHLDGILTNKPYRLNSIFRPYWRLPNRKQDTNVADLAGQNHDYPEASPQRRREIERMHRDYSMGFIYFLQNDPRVPEEIRVPARAWGLPADEFADHGHFPRQIYVREARRMRGEYVMRQDDLQRQRRKADGIALGSYAIDSHAVTTYRDEQGKLHRDGYLFVPVRPYHIAYRAMLPKREEASNLLVPVVMSSTHVAWASMRMEPVFMMTGEAAGEAAALAMETAKPLHEVDTQQLRSRLMARGARVDVPVEPIASFAWEPQSPRRGEPIRFTYRHTDGASQPKAWFWDFTGDGQPDRHEANATVTFDAAKRTLVSLIVQDESGRYSLPIAQAIDVEGDHAGDAQLDSEAPSVRTTATQMSINQHPYWGEFFHHDGHIRKGRATATYPFEIQRAGRYALYITSTIPGGRSTNTPVTIQQGDTTTTVRVSQNEINNPFGLIHVGEYDLMTGPVTVVLTNDDTDNYTIFDVVRLVYLP